MYYIPTKSIVYSRVSSIETLSTKFPSDQFRSKVPGSHTDNNIETHILTCSLLLREARMAWDLDITSVSIYKKSESQWTTHESSYAFTIPVHWNRQKPTKGLRGRQDQKRYFYTSVQYHPVREKSKSIKNHVLQKVCHSKDMQCISAVSVQNISDRSGCWNDQTKIYHTGSNIKLDRKSIHRGSDERYAGHSSDPRHVVCSTHWEI